MSLRRPRLRIVGFGTVVGLIVIVAPIAAYFATRSQTGSYVDTFDINLMASEPELARVILMDPTLRSLFLHQTEFGYTKDGWAGASRMFYDLVNSQLTTFAGDNEITACNAAWHAARRALMGSPHACRMLLDRNVTDATVKPHITIAQAICRKADLDGAQRRQTRAAPDVMTDAEYAATYARLLDSPQSLTSEERAALQDASSDDAVYCQAAVKRDNNEAFLRPEVAARFARTAFRNTIRQEVETPRPQLPSEVLTANLHCPPAGTVFTLSIVGRDGLPITWQSRGQRGWDCQLLSSASGERGLLGSDQTNIFRLFGELAVGKTERTSIILSNGTERLSQWRIRSFDRFWLPWGEVSAFSIEQDVTEGTARHYVVTQYWSPELSFLIGQHSEAKFGSLPELTAPDWQLVTMEPPSNGRGGTLTGQQAADDIRYALQRAEAVHPNLYWNVDRSKILALTETLIAALPKPPTAMDVYLALAQVAGLFGDGHIAVTRPLSRRGDVLETYRRAGGTLLLATVKPVANGLRVNRSRTEGVTAGDLLISINGHNAGDLFVRAQMLATGEADLQSLTTQFQFSERLWDFGVQAPFTLDGVFGGISGRIQVAGATGFPTNPVLSDDEGLRLTQLPDDLFLLSFNRMTAASAKFRARIADLFQQIATAKAKGLIVDLRQNFGGNTMLGDDLLDYIADRPYRLFARGLLRASPECRAYLLAKYNDYPSAIMRQMADGETRSWDNPMTTPTKNPLRFTGSVVVLIGPGTFSAANTLANAIGDFKLATLIGKDTAEIPNNYGEACPVTLPHTAIRLFVPALFTVRANGDEANRDDVHPDIKVPNADGEDVDLGAARRFLLSRTGK